VPDIPDQIIIGTRGSPLALQQTEMVRAALSRRWPKLRLDLRVLHTTGDRVPDTALAGIGEKGLFTKELERALLDGQIDLAVHSLKDLPTASPTGLRIAAVPAREDPADALVSKNGRRLEDLAPGAAVLTGSLRRRAQLLHRRPDLRIEDVRGNVQTRLRKLDEGPASALVMAAAALKRLDLAARITQRLAPESFLPACGQGALALEIRADDPQTAALVEPLDDRAARLATTAERTVLATLEGGCQVPLGAYASLEGETLRLQALIADPDGRRLVAAQAAGPADDPERLGRRVADLLLDQGGRDILAQIRNDA